MAAAWLTFNQVIRPAKSSQVKQWCKEDFFVKTETKTKTFVEARIQLLRYITSYDTNAVISQLYTQSPVLHHILSLYYE